MWDSLASWFAASPMAAETAAPMMGGFSGMGNFGQNPDWATFGPLVDAAAATGAEPAGAAAPGGEAGKWNSDKNIDRVMKLMGAVKPPAQGPMPAPISPPGAVAPSPGGNITAGSGSGMDFSKIMQLMMAPNSAGGAPSLGQLLAGKM